VTGWSWFWIFVGASIGVLAAVVAPDRALPSARTVEGGPMRAMWTGVGLLGAVMSAITFGLCKAAQRGDEPVKGYLDWLMRTTGTRFAADEATADRRAS
jgi:threonine/homoserine/homoserine lactone efflux protein